MNGSHMVDTQDESARRQEIIDTMEATFLQELAKAGANVPPRSTVTTALLRGLLWDKREDELLTRGHTTIETQVVKSSRRSALMQLVSQVWKVSKPDYDKVDSILAASANDYLRSSQSSSVPMTYSPAPDAIEMNGTRTRGSIPSSIGSSAEYDAYEALSSLSDAMAVDEPGLMNHHSSSSSWTTDQVGRAKDDRHALLQREPLDSIASVVFRSSPQLSSIKFNRTELDHHQQEEPPAPNFPVLQQSHNRFAKSSRMSPTHVGSMSSKGSSGMISSKSTSATHSSPRSPVSSPSSTGFFGIDRDRSSFDRSPFASSENHHTHSPSSRSKFPLPIDLKSLISRDSQSGSPSSAHSEDNPLSDPPTHRGTSSRSSTSSTYKLSPITPAAQYGWTGSPTSVASVANPPFSESPVLHSPSPLPNTINPTVYTSPTTPSIDPRILALPPVALGHPTLGAAAVTDHIPVWVPRTNPLVPLVLCPVRSPQGEWFYTYQPISYADMSILVAGAAAAAGSPPLGGQSR
jgi:hypothetical protein